jgi:hypothetical protein
VNLIRRLAGALLLAAPFAWIMTCVSAPEVESRGFSFAAFGDTPYFAFEALRLEKLIPEMNAQPLAFVLHVGDLKSSRDRCDDKLYLERKRLFAAIRHPFVITPGDNDWTDCHRRGGGEYDPLERLRFFRELFYSEQPRLAVERQSATRPFADYVENQRWTVGQVMFATVHVVGSNNNLGRTPDADQEYRARNAADLYWLRESFALARERSLAALVIGMHADPRFELSAARHARTGFADFMRTLREETVSFARPVLLIHGDSHNLRFDHPLRDPESGIPIATFTRLEVLGSPTAGWAKVTVDPTAEQPFAIEAFK